MIVCVCHRVSDRDIARAARDGCASFDELQGELSVATACGACDDCARDTFDHHLAQVRSVAACGAASACTSARITVHPHRSIALAAGA